MRWASCFALFSSSSTLVNYCQWIKLCSVNVAVATSLLMSWYNVLRRTPVSPPLKEPQRRHWHKLKQRPRGIEPGKHLVGREEIAASHSTLSQEKLRKDSVRGWTVYYSAPLLRMRRGAQLFMRRSAGCMTAGSPRSGAKNGLFLGQSYGAASLAERMTTRSWSRRGCWCEPTSLLCLLG